MIERSAFYGFIVFILVNCCDAHFGGEKFAVTVGESQLSYLMNYNGSLSKQKIALSPATTESEVSHFCVQLTKDIAKLSTAHLYLTWRRGKTIGVEYIPQDSQVKWVFSWNISDGSSAVQYAYHCGERVQPARAVKPCRGTRSASLIFGELKAAEVGSIREVEKSCNTAASGIGTINPKSKVKHKVREKDVLAYVFCENRHHSASPTGVDGYPIDDYSETCQHPDYQCITLYKPSVILHPQPPSASVQQQSHQDLIKLFQVTRYEITSTLCVRPPLEPGCDILCFKNCLGDDVARLRWNNEKLLQFIQKDIPVKFVARHDIGGIDFVFQLCARPMLSVMGALCRYANVKFPDLSLKNFEWRIYGLKRIGDDEGPIIDALPIDRYSDGIFTLGGVSQWISLKNCDQKAESEFCIDIMHQNSEFSRLDFTKMGVNFVYKLKEKAFFRQEGVFEVCKIEGGVHDMQGVPLKATYTCRDNKEIVVRPVLSDKTAQTFNRSLQQSTCENLEYHFCIKSSEWKNVVGHVHACPSDSQSLVCYCERQLNVVRFGTVCPAGRKSTFELHFSFAPYPPHLTKSIFFARLFAIKHKEEKQFIGTLVAVKAQNFLNVYFNKAVVASLYCPFEDSVHAVEFAPPSNKVEVGLKLLTLAPNKSINLRIRREYFEDPDQMALSLIFSNPTYLLEGQRQKTFFIDDICKYKVPQHSPFEINPRYRTVIGHCAQSCVNRLFIKGESNVFEVWSVPGKASDVRVYSCPLMGMDGIDLDFGGGNFATVCLSPEGVYLSYWNVAKGRRSMIQYVASKDVLYSWEDVSSRCVWREYHLRNNRDHLYVQASYNEYTRVVDWECWGEKSFCQKRTIDLRSFFLSDDVVVAGNYVDNRSLGIQIYGEQTHKSVFVTFFEGSFYVSSTKRVGSFIVPQVDSIINVLDDCGEPVPCGIPQNFSPLSITIKEKKPSLMLCSEDKVWRKGFYIEFANGRQKHTLDVGGPLESIEYCNPIGEKYYYGEGCMHYILRVCPGALQYYSDPSYVWVLTHAKSGESLASGNLMELGCNALPWLHYSSRSVADTNPFVKKHCSYLKFPEIPLQNYLFPLVIGQQILKEDSEVIPLLRMEKRGAGRHTIFLDVQFEQNDSVLRFLRRESKLLASGASTSSVELNRVELSNPFSFKYFEVTVKKTPPFGLMLLCYLKTPTEGEGKKNAALQFTFEHHFSNQLSSLWYCSKGLCREAQFFIDLPSVLDCYNCDEYNAIVRCGAPAPHMAEVGLCW